MSLQIQIGKKDIFCSYLAQFLSMGVGIITLPFILNRLSTPEIGLNYILITIGGIIALVDLGFAPQFARNFTYVFSGVQKLEKEGVGKTNGEINFELLKYLLETAKYVYGSLSIIALILILIIGTPYVYVTTHGFTIVPNALYVWIIFSIGVLFQIFYSYYFSMLLGAGKIKEQKYAIIGNKLLYMIILISGLNIGWGLMSVALAQLISPFFGRILSHHYFYSKKLQLKLSQYKAKDRNKIYDIYKTLWFNAKRTAIMSIGAYAILKLSMFIAGLYLSLEDFASYGLMVQLVGLLGVISCTLVQTLQPKLASLIANNNKEHLLTLFSEALNVFYLIFVAGSIILIFWGQPILSIIKSNADLPSRSILIVYCLVMFFENNHSNFALLISANNKVPFAPASIITGITVCIGIFIVVSFTNWGIMGFVAVQGICQACYQNWKWPLMAMQEYKISYCELILLGIKKFKNIIHHFR